MTQLIRSVVLVFCFVLTLIPAATWAQVSAAPGMVDTNRDGLLSEAELIKFLRVALERQGFDSTMLTPERLRRHANSLIQRSGARQPELRAADLQTSRNAVIYNQVTFGELLRLAGADDAPPTLTQRLAGVFRLRKSFLDEKAVSEAASISFASFGSKDETVVAPAQRVQTSLQAAAILSFPRMSLSRGAFELHPVATYEPTLSNGLKTDSDVIVHRIGVIGGYGDSATDRFGSTFVATFDYATDRGYNAEVKGATFQYSVVAPKAAIGKLVGSGGTKFTWRPYLRFSFGNVERNGGNASLVDYANGSLKLAATIKTPRITFTPDIEFSRQFRGTKKHYGAASLTIALPLMPEQSILKLALDLTLSTGRRPTEFKKQQSVKVALGVKF